MKADQGLEHVLAFAENHKNTILLGIILLVLYASCFLLAPQMGLYADDFLISGQWGKNLSAHWRAITQSLVDWPQGRPLIGLQKAFFGGVADALGGLRGVYILSYAVLATNAVLMFLLLRLFAPLSVAVVGALMIVLFPADAAKMTYIRAMQVQFVILLFLAAAWSYLKGHRFAPYLLIVWTIGVYETVILPFFFVPLLQVPWRRNIARDFLRHGATLIVILAGVLALRLFLGPAYLTDVNQKWGVWSALLRSVTAVLLGVFTSAKLLFLRLYTALDEIALVSGFVMAFVGFCVFIALNIAFEKHTLKERKVTAITSRHWNPSNWTPFAQLISVGILMWLAAYPLFITLTRFPPTTQLGRITSVHSAAEIGVSFVAAGLFWMAVSVWRRKIQLQVLASAVAAYFALLAGFQVTVQSELADVWTQQKSFWRSVIRASPDLNPQSLIVVNPFNVAWQDSDYPKNLALAIAAAGENPTSAKFRKEKYEKWIPWSPAFEVMDQNNPAWRSSKYAEVFPWNLQFILQQIVTVGPPQSSAPRTVWEWQMNPASFFGVRVRAENNIEIWFSLSPRSRKNMQGNIIWLEAGDQYTFKRVTGTKTIQGVPFRLKDPGPSTQEKWIKGPLYDSIFDD